MARLSRAGSGRECVLSQKKGRVHQELLSCTALAEYHITSLEKMS